VQASYVGQVYSKGGWVDAMTDTWPYALAWYEESPWTRRLVAAFNPRVVLPPKEA
jgi:hypothetical protein